MKRKYHLSTTTILILLFITAHSQNPPTIGIPEDDTLFVNSGDNFLLIPEVNDNDEGINQPVTFTVTSSDETILEVTGTDFTPGDRMAILRVAEQGKTGTVIVSIEADDGDGTASTSFAVTVVEYQHPGINFEIHDMVFWQQNIPLNSVPAFEMIAPTGKAPYDSIDLPSLNLSVYSECQTFPPCTGTDFFTSFFRGYIMPPVTGIYKFYTRSGDQANLAISSDESFDNADVIIHTSGGIGTPTGAGENEYVSDDIELEGGKTYAIYCTKWNVHNLTGGMLWEGPGIPKGYIDGQYMSYIIDRNKPTVPSAFKLITTGINDILVDWNASTDDQQLESYVVYVNGIRINAEYTLETSYWITGLTGNSRYSLAVSAIDWAGNESGLSGIITTTTYNEDSTPPNPPTSVSTPLLSDIAVRLIWSGAYDNETEIRGYRLYLNQELYNTKDLVYDEILNVYHLLPSTEYIVEIEAVDAGKNVSAKSDPFIFTTTSFDPSDTQFGDNKARMKIEFKNIATNAGLGVNVDYDKGDFNNDTRQMELLHELQPATIRWGAITANSLSFSDYIGADNPNNITLAEFMAIANELDAYTVITCGVENSTDWMTESETFTRFLEYIAGPSSSEYGAIRAAEGFQKSLLADSRGLIFEFGNEVWGAEAHDAQIGTSYVTYREWARDMALLMKSSPYYDPEKISLVYSGRHPHPDESYGLNRTVLQGDTGEIDWLALSGYLGGNFAPDIETGDTELGYFKNGIAKLKYELEGLYLTMNDMVELTGEIKPSFFYESNMTSNTFYGRLGQTIIQTDYYAEAIKYGGAVPTIFHFTGGQWKMVVPADNYRKLALYEAAKLVNRHCKGSVLKTSVESDAVIADAAGSAIDIEPVGCHAYTNNGDFGLLLISRDFTRDFTLQMDFPEEFMFGSMAKKYVLSGKNYNSTGFTIDSSDISVTDSMIVVVPRYSMIVISFSADDLGYELHPLGYFDYQRATDISIRPKEDDGFDINKLRGSKTFVTEFEPADAFIKIARWEVIDNGINMKYSTNGNEIRITSTGTCDGNGTITLKASLKDNPAISDEVSVTITNQGSNCELGTNEQEKLPKWTVYPNPVQDAVFILHSSSDHPDATVKVTNMAGEVVLLEQVKSPLYEIKTQGWMAGIYTLSIQQDENHETIRIMVK